MENMNFVSLLLATATVSMAADVGVVEEIVAKVNGDIITRGDLVHDRKQAIADLQQNGTTGLRLQQALAEHDTDILRVLIDKLLLQQKGKDFDFMVYTDVTMSIQHM